MRSKEEIKNERMKDIERNYKGKQLIDKLSEELGQEFNNELFWGNNKYYTPDIEDEDWKDISGYEGLYQVSNTGLVKSLPKSWVSGKNKILRVKGETILKPCLAGKGYLSVTLSNNFEKHFYIHKLVANHFKVNNSNLPEINHKDGNKLNNNDWNLEFCTSSQNRQHAWDNNLRIFSFKNHAKAKLSYDIAEEIRKDYQTGNFTQRKLAAKYGIVVSGINQIIKNKNWTNVLLTR